LACAVGPLSIMKMTEMNRDAGLICTDALQGSHDLAAVDSSLLKARNDYFEALNSQDGAKGERLISAAHGEFDDIKSGLSSYETSINMAEDRKNFDGIKPKVTGFVADAADFERLFLKGDRKQAGALFSGKMGSEFHEATDGMDTMFEWNNDEGKRLSKQATAAFGSARMAVIVILSIAIALGLLIGIAVTHFIMRHLCAISDTLRSLQGNCVSSLNRAVAAMESGDLTVDVTTGTAPLEVKTSEEFGQLAETCNALIGTVRETIESFGQSQESLSNLIFEIQSATTQVSGTASNLASTSQQVEAAAEEIGQTMHEISSATEQAARGATEVAAGTSTQAKAISSGTDELKTLVTAIQGVASDADSAARAVENASQLATTGGTVVNRSVAGMKGILSTVTESAEVIQTLGQRSEKIGSIVQTIEDIAGQTNLLALNAAIEAARAGEAGRGFAVVADEVRKLAERSGAATREIAALIADIQSATTEAVRSMESGVSEVNTQADLAKNAGEAFDEIEKAFTLVIEQVQRISAASEHMTGASDQVSRSITEVAAVIEQSSAAAEELSASSEEVSASVQTVASSTQQQVAAVRDLVSSSETLAGLAQNLQSSVGQFKPRRSDRAAQGSHTLRLAA